MPLSERNVVNEIAAQERAIAGVKSSFPYAENPDVILIAQLPAVYHIIPSFTCELRGHHNLWRTSFNVLSVLLVKPRLSSGGQLKFLENEAIPYGEKWRNRFQTDSVIDTLFGNLANTAKVFLTKGEYGAGGEMLTYAGTEYIGFAFTFQVDEWVAGA